MRFGVLGPLALLTDRGVDITARREQCILAMLLLHPNQDLPAPVLAEAVWADDPPSSVRGQIHDCVSRLRRRLRTAGIGPDVIRTTRAGYRVAVGPHDVDSLRFDGLTRRARDAAQDGRPETARELLEEALALWRGPALHGVSSERVRRLASALDQRRLQVRLEYARLLLQTGRPDDAAAELAEVVEQLPYHEAAHHTLMLALHRAGRSAEALDVYQRLRRRLREELGVDPESELQDLHRRILQGSSAALLRGGGAAPLLRSGLPMLLRSGSPTPPSRPAGCPTGPRVGRPRQLPGDVVDFTGRDDLLRDLHALRQATVSSTAVPVALLTGTAGVGKTALAVHFAHQVAGHFPGGLLYLDLRGHSTLPPLPAVEALAALIRSLGVLPEAVPTDVAEASALYRSHLGSEPVLVLLDDAVSTEQVRPLLPASAGSMAIVTSRHRLTGLVAHHGARLITVPALPPADACTLLTTLLVDRTAEDPQAVADLARACAYLPRALRMAAADLVGTGVTVREYLAGPGTDGAWGPLDLDDTDQLVGSQQGAVRPGWRSAGRRRPGR